MRTFEITSNCGRKIKVSESIIIHDNELYRLVSIDDNPVGWHWATKFFSAILLSECRNGVKDPFGDVPNRGTYMILSKEKCRFFTTHPLNEKRR